MVTGRELTDKLIHEVIDGTVNSTLRRLYENCVNKSEDIHHVMDSAFEYLASIDEKLATDVMNVISRYQITVNASDEIRPLDFVQLPDWYMWTSQREGDGYFDTDGEYYQLRLNDVINCYLVAVTLQEV